MAYDPAIRINAGRLAKILNLRLHTAYTFKAHLCMWVVKDQMCLYSRDLLLR